MESLPITESDLRAAYPGAADAVVWLESYPGWNVVRICGETPAGFVAYVINSLRMLHPETNGAGSAKGVTAGEVLIQVQTPDFLRYVQAKLGAM